MLWHLGSILAVHAWCIVTRIRGGRSIHSGGLGEERLSVKNDTPGDRGNGLCEAPGHLWR